MIKKMIAILIAGAILCTHTAHAEAPTVTTDARVSAIDSYYRARGMPLEGQGASMVAAADRYGLDWRLLPAISVQESTGGRHMCRNNPYGYGSCKITFASLEAATDTVGRAIGGFNPRLPMYRGPTRTKLYYYNGTVMKSYPSRVMGIMESIGR